ncbi:uncharacterized protein JCM6883_004721 [Sporobolomyces salmoneus]|uniref:uncharacterized protein n=1 Tax=Sporobolomyces salmoneus TaxID=183962 RepID=UPI00317195B7
MQPTHEARTLAAHPNPVIDIPSSSPQPNILLNDDSTSPIIPRRTPASPTPASVSRSTSLSSPSRRSKSSSRQRSLSPATSPMQALDALAGSPPPLHTHSSQGSPSTSGNKIPPPSNAFASRPSPVVPSSPSVMGSPHHYPSSRATSPRPSRHASEEPSSPTRERGTGTSNASMLGGGDGVTSTGMGRSSSQVDLSHIFERDVEFAPSHHITPSEAVDVAVPPVLTEAIIALSATDDPVVSHDVEALIHESEADAQAGSGWSSPVIPPPPSLQHSQPHPLSQQHHPPASPPSTFSHSAYANASRSPVRSSHSRSFSPDSVEGIEALSSGGEDRRAASPGGSSTTFSGGSPPTSAGEISPPATSAGGGAFGLGPFGKKLAEALENEANKLPPGLVGTVNASSTLKAPDSPSAVIPGPPSDKSPRTNSASSFSNLSPLRPSNIISPTSSLSVPFPAVGSPSSSSDHSIPLVSASPSSVSPQTELGSNPFNTNSSTTNVANPHPRRLSFISYADVINEERMAELTGEGAATGTATPAIGKGQKGGIGAELVEGRLASLLLGE